MMVEGHASLRMPIFGEKKTEKFISLIMKEPGKLTLPKGSHISLPSFQFFPLPCH